MSDCQPIVTMRVLKELFPQHNPATIWRWNSRGGGGMRLPAPDAIDEPGSPAWWLGTIVEWGKRTGKDQAWDPEVMARICQSQQVE